jgi:chemotaxis protein CheZ
MSQPPAPRSTVDAEFDAIAAAVMETARGRWFLGEYARRNRNADTRLVLDMLARIERMSLRRAGILEADRLRGDLAELSEAIVRSKTDMAAVGDVSAAETAREAPKALETIVVVSERTTGDVLNATERIQEVAWMLRERGMPASICNELDTLTAEVYSVCAAQDLNHRRIVLLTDLLRLVEGRIETMLAAKRREDAEAQALVQFMEEGRIPLDLHLPVVPAIAPEAAAPKPAVLSAPEPAVIAAPAPEAKAAPEPAPVPAPVAVATLEPAAAIAPAPEPIAAIAPAPQPVASIPVPEVAAASAAAADVAPPEPVAPPVRPARPNFERLSTVERIALFS